MKNKLLNMTLYITDLDWELRRRKEVRERGLNPLPLIWKIEKWRKTNEKLTFNLLLSFSFYKFQILPIEIFKKKVFTSK